MAKRWRVFGATDKRKRVLSTDSLRRGRLKKRFSSVHHTFLFLLLMLGRKLNFSIGQAHKQSLSSCVVDEEENVERHFSLDSLRQLFQLNEDTLCDTHDTFKCRRCVHNRQVTRPPESEQGIKAGATAQDTSTWNHYSQLEINKVHDSVLRECATQTNIVSFVFQNKVTQFPSLFLSTRDTYALKCYTCITLVT